MQRPPRSEDLSANEPDRSDVRSDLSSGQADSNPGGAEPVIPLAQEELLISATSFETRLAVVSEGLLQELHITPTGDDSQVGTIALGKVMRVLPGMQAAFVELGLARPGFLHARDIERPLVAEDGSMVDARDIRKLVHEGQVLPVQVVKDPLASKGARLTTNLALPSRFLVLTPDSAHIGVSQRISDAEERDRLRDVVTECSVALGLPHDHGFIVRTAGEGATYQDFMSDMQALLGLWRSLETKRIVAKTGDPLFRDLPNHIRMLRDLVGPQTRLICVDDAAAFEAVSDFCKTTLPDYQHPIKKAKENRPLFERYGLEAQIKGALKPRVSLPSGGYLIVEQTEAMVTVDVNTGGFTGTHSLEETVFQTNLEAAQALPRQLRLRNLGGLIVVDFIDMESAEHKSSVLRELRAGCGSDAARIRVSSVSEFGLVELSRKRTRESLARQLCEPCDRCDGRGLTVRPQTVAFEILRALNKLPQSPNAINPSSKNRVAQDNEHLVIAAAPVVSRLLEEDAEHLGAIAKRLGSSIELQSDNQSPPERWELVQRPANSPVK